MFVSMQHAYPDSRQHLFQNCQRTDLPHKIRVSFTANIIKIRFVRWLIGKFNYPAALLDSLAVISRSNLLISLYVQRNSR